MSKGVWYDIRWDLAGAESVDEADEKVIILVDRCVPFKLTTP